MSPIVGLRCVGMALCLLALLGACGEDPDALAAERCKGAVREMLGARAKLGSGETRRAGYRCLFVVENRETPLFLAVVER